MQILMLTRYGQLGSSSRYRLLQYIPRLQKVGHQVDVRPLLTDAYVKDLYSTGRRNRLDVTMGYLRRMAKLHTLSRYDLVLCEQEFFPYLPAAADLLAASFCARLIVDYDDAAYSKYSGLPLLRDRIAVIMARSESVVVGNHCLEIYASQHSDNVHVIPTVVDLDRYSTKRDYSAPDGVRLVWIGTPITASYLEEIAPVLLSLKTKYSNLHLRLIGAGNTLRKVLPFAEVVPWSEDSEARLLGECDIGIMPLPDNDFTRGKCGLKLIQCMAAGLPVVGSPVGANCEIVAEAQDGFLAGDVQSWSNALDQLIASQSLRRQLGQCANVKVSHKYSIDSGFAAWLRVIDAEGFHADGTVHDQESKPCR